MRVPGREAKLRRGPGAEARGVSGRELAREAEAPRASAKLLIEKERAISEGAREATRRGTY